MTYDKGAQKNRERMRAKGVERRLEALEEAHKRGIVIAPRKCKGGTHGNARQPARQRTMCDSERTHVLLERKGNAATPWVSLWGYRAEGNYNDFSCRYTLKIGVGQRHETRRNPDRYFCALSTKKLCAFWEDGELTFRLAKRIIAS